MARSIIDEIVKWKERRGRSRLASELASALALLRDVWTGTPRIVADENDYFVIRLVTIMEVFLREMIRELVDSGPPYIDRAEKLSRNARMDYALLAGLGGKKISVGDLIAHSVPLSSLASIVSAMDALIPDFATGLREAFPRWTEDEDQWPLAPIIGDFDSLMATLNEVFAVRHILVHEVPRTAPYEPGRVLEYIDAGRTFVEALEWQVIATTQGSVFRTQAGMNSEAGDSLNKLLQELETVLAQVKILEEVDAKALQASQEAWQAFAAAEAELHASLVEGGSMYPMVWATAKAELVAQRVKGLRWWLERDEYDF